MAYYSRRTFLARTGIALGTAFYVSRRGFAQSPNDKLNVAFIGTAGQAGYSIGNLKSENVVALCDVDENSLKKAAQQFPEAQKYDDFRRMLEQKNIDAVVISTPDHTHAVATVASLQSGRHVYCEKPLTRTISECRIVQKAAEQANRATQIGTQIHAGDNYRRVVELVQSGAIGAVSDVHVWVGANYGGQTRPTDTPPVPAGLNYDLWLGPVEYRPYHPEYLPFKWRHWWAFGGGALADMGCHFMDLAHWSLGLGAPLTAEAEGPAPDPESPPPSLLVRYEYANPNGAKPLRVAWYHGSRTPELLSPRMLENWKSGVLFVGDKGQILSNYSRHLLLPEEKFVDFARPEPFIPSSVGHHREWVNACKTGSPTTCGFGYSGTLTEAVLLGNVAFRTGKKLKWNSKELRAANAPEADEYIQHQYRSGWRL